MKKQTSTKPAYPGAEDSDDSLSDSDSGFESDSDDEADNRQIVVAQPKAKLDLPKDIEEKKVPAIK